MRNLIFRLLLTLINNFSCYEITPLSFVWAFVVVIMLTTIRNIYVIS